MIASLGFRTDLMLLELQGTDVRHAGGHVVVSTPANPGFWWGNFVLAPGPEAVGGAVEIFVREHADKQHVAIGVDGTDGAPGLDPHGLEVDRYGVLSAAAVHPPPRPNAEAELRPVTSPEEIAAFQGSCHPEDAPEFLRERAAGWSAMAEAGHGSWFGAYLEDRLVTSLGVFTDGHGVARYQAVDTHPDFRRRGLAATLVHFAGASALSWPGVERLVIGADPEWGADRVYRSVGFAGEETQVQMIRRPPGRR